MDIQSTLTLMIQAVVMSFVALMVFDFMDGLWGVPLPPASWQPPVIEPTTVSAPSPLPTPESAPQFEEIPDPWSLAPQSPQHRVHAPSSVIVSFPTLRLLPPAKVQATKSTRKKSSTSPKSPKSTSSTKRKSTKSRTLTA